jgi:hypothetical protein
MMSFLTYIMGFFINFELLSILIDYVNQKKRGDEIKKKSLMDTILKGDRVVSNKKICK